MSFSVVDSKDRVLIEVGEDEIAVSRYMDLSEEEKDYIVKVYGEITNENMDSLRQFLDYKETEDEFCA